MKLRSFISRLQELNAYLGEFPPDTEGQETAPLSAKEIMDIIYHSMPTIWKNKLIEQGFNYANSTIKEMTDFFLTRVKKLEPKEDKKKSSAAAKKTKKGPHEKEKGRLRLQCRRVQRGKYQSSSSKQEVLHSTQ